MKPILRRLARSPVFAVIILITLAIGIGANTAIFSVLNGVLLKPLPYPDSDRLVAIWETSHLQGMPQLNASPSTYFTFREDGRAFQDIGIWRNDSVNITGTREPEQVAALDVTDGVLPVLGVQPVRGRWFTRKDDAPGGPKTVILTYGYWQRKFGGEASAIGRRILVDGEASEIIGIMPADFRFMNSAAALIEPLQLDRAKTFVGNFSYQAVARLKPGATLAQANADVARMLPMMLEKFPMAPGISLKMAQEAHFGPSVRPLKNDVVGNIGSVLWVLMATIGVVLFIACANVANLMLVRAEGRQQELAIRAALGAGSLRIARELLLESMAMGIAGGVAGVALAYAALKVLVSIGPANLPRLEEITIDPSVLLFTLAISLVAGLLFGLIPVFKYAGPRLNAALRQGGRNSSDNRERHRARSVLVIVQVALALVLLIGSGLMIRTARALKQVQPGFTQPEQILTLGVSIPDAEVPKTEMAVRTYNNILEKVAAIPGVSAAGLANSITMDGNNDNDPIFAADKAYADGQIPPLRRYKFISPGFFKAMGNPLLAGRDLTWTDIYQTRPVVLVSEALARELWRDPVAALGKQIRESPKGSWREVVGVVGNDRDDGVDQKATAAVYWPMMLRDFWGQPVMAQRGQIFAIRSTRTGTAGLLDQVRRAVWSVNPNLPIANVRTVREVYDRSMARTAFTLVMLSIAAGMALLLGVVGIYGVISYAVSQRTREIGIRMALGAPQQSVRRMFVREGLLLTAIGVVCGLTAAAGLTHLMKALLFEVSPLDPATYCAVSLVLAAAALLASYIPARRATLIAPVQALRE
jgi:putative ABC transport system permease protein